MARNSILKQMLQRYTLKEREEEMRTMIRLKTQNYEQTKSRDFELLSIMSELIIHQKRRNSALLTEIRINGPVDRQILRQVFGKHKRLFLELQGSTVVKARDTMNDKICDVMRMMNRLEYLRQRNKEYIETIKQEIKYYKKFSYDAFDANIIRIVLRIESDINKIKSKYHTAYMINRRYKSICQRLADEAHALPSYMDTIVSAYSYNMRELADMQAVNKETYQILHQFMKEAQQMESYTAQRQLYRDETSSAIRTLIFQQQQEFDRQMQKKKEEPESEITAETMKDMTNKKMEILAYTDKFDTIKNGILVSNQDAVVEMFVNSDDMLSSTENRKCDLERHRVELWQQLDQLRNERATYYKNILDNHHNIAEQEGRINHQLVEEAERKKMLKEERKSAIILYIEAAKAVDSILNKLLLATTGKPSTDSTAIAVFKQDEDSVLGKLRGGKDDEVKGKGIKLICDKMNHCAEILANMLNSIISHPDGRITNSLLPCIIFHEEFEKFANPLPTSIVKMRLSLNEGGADIFDSSTSSKVLTREEMKKKSLQFEMARRKPGRS